MFNNQMLKTLQTVSASVIGAPCDQKMLTLWEHYVTKGGFTVDDFRDAMIKSPQFADACRTAFEKRAEILGIDASFDNFWIDKNKNNELVDIDQAKIEINQFLVGMPQFKTRYEVVVKQVAEYETDGPATTPADLDFYRARFAADPAYDTLTLAADIRLGLHLEKAAAAAAAADQGQSAHPSSPSVPLHLANRIAPPAPFDVDRLEAFEGVFQRAMYVQEYFKYQATDQDLPALLATHNANYNRMREIFETYTGKTISEYYFVHQFLFSVDKPEFFENIVDDIVASPEYKSSMTAALEAKYAAMFDTAMSEIDVDYTFDIVRRQKIPIVSDRVVEILSNLKEESDGIIGNIIRVYNRVLDRPPDMNEIEQYVVYYRQDGTDAELEKILMRTLEFHDSIKKRIRAEHVALRGREILPSLLFDILNRVIVGLADLDMHSLDDKIRVLLDGIGARS